MCKAFRYTLKTPMISIIITNYNGKRFLDSCLSSVLQVDYPSDRYEIILVDNASTDGSIEYVRSKFPSVKALSLHKNYGFTGGNNIGAQTALGDFIVFLNNDTIVDKDWLSELVTVTVSDSRIGICGSKIISMKDCKTIAYNGRVLHILGGVIPGKFHTFKSKSGEKIYIVGSIQGSSFLIRKNIFRTLGGFDKDYFLYSDEFDICYRTWINGYYVAYAPNSIVYHCGGGTAGVFNRHKSSVLHERLKSSLRIYYGNRNSIINILKNLELRNALFGFVFSFLFLLFQLFALLTISDINRIWLLINAYIWPMKNLKSVWRKRAIIQKSRRVTDNKLVRKGILLPISRLIKAYLRRHENWIC